MKTYIIPAEKISIRPQPQTIATFTEKEASTQTFFDAQDPTYHKKDFKSASETAHEQKLLHTQKLIKNAEHHLKKLQASLATLKTQHQTTLKEQTHILENTLKENKTQAEAIIVAAQKKANTLHAEAEKEAETIIQTAQQKSKTTLVQTEQQQQEIKEAAHKEGLAKGFTEGQAQHKQEAERLNALTKKVLAECIRERSNIITRSEAHLIDLCLLLVKKIVKRLAEKDRQLVITTIRDALKRADGWVNLKIRVNTLDWNVTQATQAEFYAFYESIKNITLLEDPAVEPGGCIIESDQGAIDARISSQLQQLELALRDITPIPPSI